MVDKRNRARRIALLSPAVGTPNVGDHFIEEAVRRLLREDVIYERFSTRRPLSQTEFDSINDSDSALLCGTNLYQHDWHSALTPESLARIKVPVIPFGVGGSARHVNDLAVSDMTRKMITLIHSKCAVGGVRDPHAADVLQRIGIENIMLTGCPVLFWAGEERLPKIQPIPRSRIVVTARNWLMHRSPKNVDHPTQIRFLRRVIDDLSSDGFVFAVHEEWDERLVKLLPIPQDAVFRTNDPKDYLRLYTDPRHVVLANRLHAGMLSIANGVPAVFVGHDSRTYSFCQMMGLDCIELFGRNSAAAAIAQIRRLMDGDVSMLDSMQASYCKLRVAMHRFLVANSLPARWTP